jgi:hypothetical protein
MSSAVRPDGTAPMRTSSPESIPSLFQSCTENDWRLPRHSEREIMPSLLRSIDWNRYSAAGAVEALLPVDPLVPAAPLGAQ